MFVSLYSILNKKDEYKISTAPTVKKEAIIIFLNEVCLNSYEIKWLKKHQIAHNQAKV